MTTASGAEIFDFAVGSGGRIFDLPRPYQDKVAEVVRLLHPGTVTRRVQRVMASEGYLGSKHPLIRGCGNETGVTDGAG